MAVQLYRAGNSHNVRGVSCEVKNFTLGQFEDALKDGWLKSPEDISDGVQEETQGNDEEDAKEEAGKDEKEDAEKVLNPVRLKAKEAGIDGWENKRIKTLEGELNEQQD